MATLIPELSLGASIGSLFYLLSSRDETGYRKTLLALVGWAVGYAVAKPFMTGEWGLLIAIVGSAFAVSILLQISDSFDPANTGPPTVFVWVVDLFNKIRKG